MNRREKKCLSRLDGDETDRIFIRLAKYLFDITAPKWLCVLFI